MNPIFQAQFMDIKKENKIALADYFKKTTGVEINPDSIFDIQVKADFTNIMRQLLNILHVLSLYNKLKVNPGLDMHLEHLSLVQNLLLVTEWQNLLLSLLIP